MNFSATASVAQDGASSQPKSPLTVAEKSDFKSTSRSAEVIEFVDECAANATHVSRFVWGKTVEGRDLIGAIVADRAYSLGDQDDRNVVLLLGNIHSGECAGKEALLMLLRELTYRPDHPWLKNNVVIFAPNYNADGNDRMGKLNRRGQVGPENGMGRRENAQQLDLNRDFCKIDSPEGQALVALINKCNPHLFVDCHTTNGSKHRYQLTYAVPNNPTTAPAIGQFLRDKMMPEVSRRLEGQGIDTFYYGNFDKDHTKWQTYGHEPRYSTEYVGLRGRLAILSEAYAYISYRDRIFATKDFVSTLMDYATEHHSAIHQLLDSVDQELINAANTQPERIPIALDAKAGPFEYKCTLKGFKDGQPHEYVCEFVGKYDATKLTTMPYAYVVPKQHARAVDRLIKHGVLVEQLTADVVTDVEVDTITELTRVKTPFQKHNMVRAESARETGKRQLAAGSYMIRTSQPLGRFISYMLESASDDGLVFWNFFDDTLAKGEEYPVVRLPHPIALATRRISEVERVGQIDLDLIDGSESLLSGISKPAKWFGSKNWLTTISWNRERLIDAETAAFVNRPARPYDIEKLTAALEEAGLDKEQADELADEDPIVSTNGQFAIFNGERSFLYFTGNGVEDENRLVELGSSENSAELFDFNKQEDKLGYVTKDGLQLLDLQSRQNVKVAAVNDDNLVGKLDWVYQEELYGRGNFKAFWWNPQGDSCAFLSLDESPVLPFTVMDHVPVRGKPEVTNYPKAGDPLPKIKLGVVNAESGSVTWVDLSQYEDDEFLISRVTWSSDGEILLVQIQNRVQTWLDLVAVDRNGDNPRKLFRDQTKAWIESPGDPELISDEAFLWLSPRDGYKHLYKYSLTGELLDQLTSGDWEVRALLGVDPQKKYCYFTAAKEKPTEVHGYRLDLGTGEISQLTQEPGSHRLDFSDDFSLFVDRVSTVSQPPRNFLCRNDGSVVRRLDVSADDRLDYLQVREPEFLTIQAADGHTLDAKIILPPDFDANKKYPVLFHIYAGPQAPRVQNRFGGAGYLWHQMLAQKGYVIWMCDNRSASYRSAKDVWPVHKNFAAPELEDIEASVEWLKQQAWVDDDRIGIWGWSYGGYMTLYAMTNSQHFKMGISGAPVTDWKNYDAIYTERYMGLPKDNPKGYESSSVLNKAENLHGKLLLVHGTIDDNVHLNNTMQFVKELQHAGKQFDLMLYPENRHSVRNKKQSAHLRKLMTEFVLENL